MKNWLICTFIAFCYLCLPQFLLAQNATLSNPSTCGLNLPITDNNCPEGGVFYEPDRFAINVNNAPGTLLGTNVYLKEVRLIIRHPWSGDLDLSLVSPSGKTVKLSFDNGGGDDNYGNPDISNCGEPMVFSVAACQSITQGQAPFLDGIYQPQESFFLLNDGTTNPNGQWFLQICDDAPDDEGTLEFVELVFESTSCLPVSSVSVLGVDTTSVRLDWTPDGCTPMIIEYGPPGFIPGVNQNPGQGTVAFANACAPHNLQGLQPDTEYEIYIRRRCTISSTFSENSCAITVRTGCLPPPQTIVERFDTYASCATTCGAICDFPGIWRNSNGDGFDWLVHEGDTPTASTGPSEDVNGGNGKYIYLEASGAACNNGKECHLLSNCIRINKQGADTCHLSFNYHMWGTNIGKLRLQASIDGGATWSTMWEKVGDQGNQWHKVYLSLNQFADNAIVRFRFVGIGGNGSRGDIALDNIVFFGSEDLGAPDTPFYADADGDGFGNPNQFILSCLNDIPSGYTLIGDDCNDNNPNIHPNATEITCNGIDNNCNGNADENVLPPPVVTNDTICSGGAAVICAMPIAGRPIFWYTSPDGTDVVGTGTCFFPDLPLNNSAVPITYRFYAQETDFICGSGTRSEAIIVVNPNPNISHNTTPEVCPGEAFDLTSLTIEDANFTGASISFHNASPANDANRLSVAMVNPIATTTYYYLATTPEGCKDEQSVTVFAKPAPNFAFVPAKAFSLCLESTERVIVNASGGGGNYTYLWSTGENDTDIVINAGNIANISSKYFITVTDAGECVTIDSVEVTSTNSIDSVRVSTTNTATCTGNDGSITLTPLAGQSPFRYEWSSANGISGSIDGILGAYTINNLPQGVYRITITDNSTQACEFFLRQVFVNGPAAIVRTPNIKDVSCAGALDGAITLNVTGINPQYLWSIGATTPSIQNIPGGMYAVTITDGACETVLEGMEVKEPEALTIVEGLSSPSCSNATDGMIELSVFGGTKNYNFLWNTGSRREDLDNVNAGIYTLTLTDANDCQLVKIIDLQAPQPLGVIIDSLHNITCFENSDGFVKVTANGGTPPYRYLWNTGSIAPVLANVKAGNYSVTVTDFNGCQQVLNVPIAQPALLQLSIANQVAPQCIGDNTGILEAVANGGSQPYTFVWNTGTTGSTITNLGVGTYSVTLTDAKGCFGDSLKIELDAASPIAVAIVVDQPDCIGRNDGSINLQPTGTAPFSYIWSRGDITQNLNNVGVGTYAVTVEDAEGCLFDTSIIVDAPQVFDLNITPFQPSCFQSTDGAIEVNFFSAGTPPLAYNWSNGSTMQDLSGLSNGDYVLSLRDSRGCVFVSDTIKIVNPEPLDLNVEAFGQITCTGDSTGFIEIAVEGGTAPYDYDWVGTGETTDDIFNLSAGDYRLVVLDANQCPIDTTFRLVEPAELLTEIIIESSDECDQAFSNEIRAVTKGGRAPYEYLWSTGVTDSIVTNLPPGEYQLLVRDANGCSELIPSIKLRDAGKALSIDTFFVKDITCFGANDGAMTVRISGGAAPFIFHFSENTIIQSNSREATVTGLPQDSDYSVTITDLGSGCVVATPKKAINQPTQLSFIFNKTNEPNCFSSADGAIFASTYGGVQPYTFQWVNQNGTQIGTKEDLTGIPNGTYTGYVIDTRGCRDTILQQQVSNNNDLIRFANPPIVQDASCRNNANGAINVTIQGGAPPYEYRWSNNRTTEDIANLAAGAYTLTLTDADTCRVIFPAIIVDQPDSDISILGKPNNVLCHGDTTGSIEVLVSGGTGPYEYIWEYRGSLFVEDTSNLSGLRAGIYKLSVRDTNQCFKTATFEITEPPQLQLDMTFEEGNIALAIASGGVPDYTYLWNTGETTQQILIPQSGDYSVTVTDNNNCIIIENATLVDDNEAIGAYQIKVYPNPSTGEVWLEVDLPKALNIELEVWNTLGQRVIQQQAGSIQQTKLLIDLKNQPSGLYWLNAYANGRSIYSEKLIVEK
ncbi:MAG: T9SS type A sorting domain-containing protein [Saprospiraceae bacterium]|nr:T9SS type A sorting domain-containing protein [Saprospiraceae bacterium]